MERRCCGSPLARYQTPTSPTTQEMATRAKHARAPRRTHGEGGTGTAVRAAMAITPRTVSPVRIACTQADEHDLRTLPPTGQAVPQSCHQHADDCRHCRAAKYVLQRSRCAEGGRC